MFLTGYILVGHSSVNMGQTHRKTDSFGDKKHRRELKKKQKRLKKQQKKSKEKKDTDEDN